MNKGKLLILCLITALLVSCASVQRQEAENHLQVVATVFPCYDFAHRIGGDLCDVTMLITPGTEPHGYEPTLADTAKLSECDLLLCGGGESDVWAAELVEGHDRPAVFQMNDCVALLPEHEGHEDEGYDEHVWTSPANAQKIALGICEQMCLRDPENAPAYRENCAALLAQLEALDDDFAQLAAASQGCPLIFADRFPFAYLAKDYGFECFSALDHCGGVTEPSLNDLAELIDVARTRAVRGIFYLEFSDDRTAQTIAEAVGAKTLRLHSCHNVTKAEWDAGASYVSLMQENLQAIKTAAGQEY